MTDAPFENETAKYTTTLKGGAGYDAPWIVVRSNGVPELKSDVGALDDEAFALVKSAGQRFSGAGVQAPTAGAAAQHLANAGMVSQAQVTDTYAADAAAGGPGAFAAPEVASPAPVAPPAPAAPAGNAPVCKHGPMKFLTGTSKKPPHRPYRMWVCDTPQGTPDQCKAQFVN